MTELPRVFSTREALEMLQAKRQVDAPQIAAMYSSYVGGVITDPALMAVPLDDHMVHRGHGVFDTASLHEGRLYRLGIHLDRLLSSAAAARIDHGFTKQQLIDIVVGTAAVSGLREGSVRYWLTQGPGGFSFDPSECSEACFYCVIFESFTPAGDEDPDEGYAEVTIRNTPMKPKLLANIKSNNYLLNVLTHLEATDGGGRFGILVDDDGFVAEGAVVNVCFVTNSNHATPSMLITPPFDDILMGTTVRRVMQFSAGPLVDEGLIVGVEQRPIAADEMRGTIDEMFLVGGDTHMFPITSWDGDAVGTGRTGAVTARLLELLEGEAEQADTAELADRSEQFFDVPYPAG